MTDLFYTDSEAGYWKLLQAFWSGLWKPYSVVISRCRYSEAPYGKIIRFSQSFHYSKNMFWILTAIHTSKQKKKIKNTQHTFRKYWFNLWDLQNKYNISWHCPFNITKLLFFSHDKEQDTLCIHNRWQCLLITKSFLIKITENRTRSLYS
jgi:hypothetical protein